VRKLSSLVVPAFLVVLNACGGSAAPAGSSPAASAPAAPGSASAAAPGSSAAAASGAPIKIGLLQPLTGIYANQGKDHTDGFQLYLDSINSTVAGRKIQLVVADDQGTPDVGLTKAKQLVDSDKVDILAGGTITPECYALAPYARDAKVPFVNTGNCIGYDLTISPKYASPYLVRVSAPLLAGTDPFADWAYKHGNRKADIMVSDYAAGHQIADAWASIFVKDGGSIVQENYPAQGTTDFGPFLAKLDKSADTLFAFLPGVDGLRMQQAFADYADPQKMAELDYGGGITSGPNTAQLKDKAVGIWGGATPYVDSIDTPANQALLKAFKAKFPGRLIDADVDRGYDGAAFIVAAIKAANGNVQDKSATGPLITAIHNTQIDGARGPMKLDQNGDVVQNAYIQQVVKNGSDYAFKIVATYQNVGKDWDRSATELKNFPFGQLGGKWVGMTAATLPKVG